MSQRTPTRTTYNPKESEVKDQDVALKEIAHKLVADYTLKQKHASVFPLLFTKIFSLKEGSLKFYKVQ